MLEIGDRLFLGDHRDALHICSGPSDVRAMLTVMNDSLMLDSAGIHHLRISAPDGPGFEVWHVAAAVAFLRCVHSEQAINTIIHCWSGRSRSVGVLTAYLHSPFFDSSGSIFISDSAEETAMRLREMRGVGRSLPEPPVWDAVISYLHSI